MDPDAVQQGGTGRIEYLLIPLVVWVVAGASTASWLAVERGRDPAPWFLLGALLGPLALFMVGFPERVPRNQFKACLECQEAIPKFATTCPHCGTDLVKAEEEESDFRAQRASRQAIAPDMASE